MSECQWQSIETAPRDGSIFLAAYPDGTVTTCKWFAVDGDQWTITGYFDHEDQRAACCSSALVYVDGDPVFWLPLPAAPMAT